MKKKILIILATLILLPITWIIYGSIDEERREFPELVPQRVEVPDEENGFVFFQKFTDDLEIARAEQVYEKSSKLMLEKHSGVFECIDGLIVYKNFIVPAVQDIADEQKHLWQIRELVRLQKARVELFHKQGDQRKTFDELKKILMLAKLLEQQPETLIDFLVRFSCFRFASDTVNELVKAEVLDQGKLLELRSLLERFTQNHETWKFSLMSEYRALAPFYKLDFRAIEKQGFGIGFIDGTGDEFLKVLANSSYGWHKNRSYHIVSRYFRELLQVEPKDLQSAVLPKINFEEREVIWKPNGFGMILLNDTHRTFNKALRRIYESWARLRLLDLSIACHLYKLDHQIFPASLSILTPKYIKEIPLDPMDGQPLRYNAEKSILYSVGHDFKDNGGVSNDDMNGSYSPDQEKDFTLHLLPRDK